MLLQLLSLPTYDEVFRINVPCFSINLLDYYTFPRNAQSNPLRLLLIVVESVDTIGVIPGPTLTTFFHNLNFVQRKKVIRLLARPKPKYRVSSP